MKREAFKMQLKPGFEEEYKKRHDKVWPDILAELKKAGVSDYSIYLDPETLILFGSWKVTDDNTTADLPSTAAVKKWWAYMKDIMDSNPDNSPVCTDLIDVFYME